MLVTQPGLADPVHQSQAIFRTLLTALSEPGRVLSVDLPPVPALTAGPAAIAALLSLADGDTPLWLDGQMDALAAYLRFHTGAPIATDPQAAQFALVVGGGHLPLSVFNAGSEDYPDQSATLIIEVAHLAEQGAFILRGPGMPGHRSVDIQGLPAKFATQWATNHALFPCGLDVILTCGQKLMGLPRTTHLETSCM